MKKLKLVALLPLLFFITSTIAQTKIVDNGIATDPSALLELQSATKGFLLTRVALTATNAVAPLTTPVAGIEVYNTATAGIAPYIVTPGVYYYNGTIWVREDAANQWSLLGNVGTVDGTNFIGTTDNVPLTFKVNNVRAARIESTPYAANTSFGYDDLAINTGSGNTAFGAYALPINTTGSSNFAMGFEALQTNTTGSNNVAVGAQALQLCCTAGNDGNTAVGLEALNTNTGIGNTGVGLSALQYNSSGTYNTGIGYRVGAATGYPAVNYSTAIGVGAGFKQNNTMNLGGDAGTTSAVKVGIGTGIPTSTLQVIGSVAAAITTVTSSTTLDNTYSSVLVNGLSPATITITLPNASTCSGRIYRIKNIGGHNTTVTATGGIDFGAVNINTRYQSVTVQSDGTNWWIMQ